jgi:hypothetical protein
MDQPPDDDLETRWGKDLFNRVWTLLEMEKRSLDDDIEMIHTVHASCYHWSRVGQPVNFARGEWQCSRVYATLGRAESAIFHAERCRAICADHGIGDFDLAFAYEALARAHAVAGDRAESDRWAELARAACGDIKDDDDRQIVLTDLATLPQPT